MDLDVIPADPITNLLSCAASNFKGEIAIIVDEVTNRFSAQIKCGLDQIEANLISDMNNLCLQKDTEFTSCDEKEKRDSERH